MFAGTGTALITPFSKDGSVDEEALRRLVNFQEENGVNTLVPCGSTGESAMMSYEEHLRVISIVVDEAKKAKVLAGAGSNCTSEAVILSKKAEDLGADGILSISPYYVKPTQEGIYLHYKAIEEAVDCPIIVYNIPGRTGSNITVDTLLRLAELPGIVGVKEASGDITKIAKIRANCPDEFAVWSGNDDLAAAVMALGGSGVISVLSNVLPEQAQSMARAALDGDFDTAADLQIRMLPLIEALFSEVNPIPVKAAMKLIGYDCGECRLPLTPISQENMKKLKSILLAN